MYLLTVFFLSLLTIGADDPVFYRSSSVPFELLEKAGDYPITDDKGNTVSVELLLDKQTKQLYWYRRLFTEVCLTGECRPVDIGIYWTGSGRYLGVEIFREHLTKTDHSDFSDFDYRKLETVLKDEWSPLREFEFEELVEEKKEGVDATTGATKKVIADASVKDAVYTTYTMWHLIHVGEGEQLALLTYHYLNQHPEILSQSIQKQNPDYYHFLIEGISSGILEINSKLTAVILQSLGNDNASLKNTAFKAINTLPLNEEAVQNEIAIVYKEWTIPDKNRFLQSLSGLEILFSQLYQALASDLTEQNSWFLSSLIPVLSKHRTQTKEVINKIKYLEKSETPQVREAAKKFLGQFNPK